VRLSFGSRVLCTEYPDAISLGRFDKKSGFSGERQQVPITAYEKLRLPTQSQVEEGLIIVVAADDVGLSCSLDDFAKRKIVRQQFSAVAGGKVKFRVSKYSGKLGYGNGRNQRYAAALPPMTPKPG
jgi:hypothetical protein